MLGFNYRMNELQGAVGLAQLGKLDTVLAAQRKNKKAIKETLGALPGVRFRELPDPEGDSGTTLAFNLPEEALAEKFQKALGEQGVGTVCFKRNFWHYVPNWEHFLAKSTANSRRYPFADPINSGNYSYGRERIPRAEDILGRTLVMGISVKMPQEKMDGIRTGIEKAAAAIL